MDKQYLHEKLAGSFFILDGGAPLKLNRIQKENGML